VAAFFATGGADTIVVKNTSDPNQLVVLLGGATAVAAKPTQELLLLAGFGSDTITIGPLDLASSLSVFGDDFVDFSGETDSVAFVRALTGDRPRRTASRSPGTCSSAAATC
jgi:hypothetical protein